jgi:hypothetical protein
MAKWAKDLLFGCCCCARPMANRALTSSSTWSSPAGGAALPFEPIYRLLLLLLVICQLLKEGVLPFLSLAFGKTSTSCPYRCWPAEFLSRF